MTKENLYAKRMRRELGIANIKFEEDASDEQLEKLLTKEERRRDDADEPAIGATRYIVNVDGQDIQVEYLPHWLGGDIVHIEFKTEGANAISESGFRSHFLTGNPEDYGITDDTVQEKLQELADVIAKEEKPKRATRLRQEKREENKKAKEKAEKNQTVLF